MKTNVKKILKNSFYTFLIILIIISLSAIIFAGIQYYKDWNAKYFGITDSYCQQIGYQYKQGSRWEAQCCSVTEYADTILGKFPLSTKCSKTIFSNWEKKE